MEGDRGSPRAAAHLPRGVVGDERQQDRGWLAARGRYRGTSVHPLPPGPFLAALASHDVVLGLILRSVEPVTLPDGALGTRRGLYPTEDCDRMII
jgi:hypothetical protein